jgi:hypothetical protein
VEEMLGNQGVTESNMMQYLGIIEQRTSEILQTHALNQTASGGGAMPMGGGGAMLAANIRQGGAAAAAAAGARKIQVQPPGLDDLSSEESDAEVSKSNILFPEFKRVGVYILVAETYMHVLFVG